jgi:membrane protein implicated in regulation of membrane protease activity
MLLVIAVVCSLLFLDGPIRWVIIGLAAVIELAEVGFWLFWNHKRKVRVGAETMIGRRAVVIRSCLPEGQVRLDGEIWRARCADGVAEGEDVVVEGLDGLILDVRPTDS